MAHSLTQNPEPRYVVAAFFHQLRAFMTVTSEALEAEKRGLPLLSFYNRMGEFLPWEDVVVHSQGRLVDTRERLVLHEVQRIRDYQNIRPAEDILAYMDRRA